MRLAVLGAGPGGQGIAAALTLAGHAVSLWFPGWTDKRHTKLRAVSEDGIILTGVLQGRAKPRVVTSDLREAVTGSELVIISTPAVAHHEIGRLLGPHCTPNQVVLLAPGRTGGALQVAHILEQVAKVRPVVAETSTLPLTCRLVAPNQVLVADRKVDVGVACLPAKLSKHIAMMVAPALSLSPRASTLHTSFENLGAIFHVVGVLLNAGQAERTGIEVYYRDAITPAIARVMEAVDHERVRTAQAYGVTVPSALELMNQRYRTEEPILYDAISHSPAYAAIGGIAGLQHRYLLDDLPMSVAPLVALGEVAAISTPLHRGLLTLGSALMSVNYARSGRSLEAMGLSGMTVDEIRRAATA